MLASAIVASFVGDLVRGAFGGGTPARPGCGCAATQEHVPPKVRRKSRPWSMCRRIVLERECARAPKSR